MIGACNNIQDATCILYAPFHGGVNHVRRRWSQGRGVVLVMHSSSKIDPKKTNPAMTATIVNELDPHK